MQGKEGHLQVATWSPQEQVSQLGISLVSLPSGFTERETLVQLLGTRTGSADPLRGLAGGACSQGRASSAGCCQPAGLQWGRPPAGAGVLRASLALTPGCSSLGLCCGTRAAGQPLNLQQNQIGAWPCSPLMPGATSRGCSKSARGGLINDLGCIRGKGFPLPSPLRSSSFPYYRLCRFSANSHAVLVQALDSPWLGGEVGSSSPTVGVGRDGAQIWVSPKSGMNRTCRVLFRGDLGQGQSKMSSAFSDSAGLPAQGWRGVWGNLGFDESLHCSGPGLRGEAAGSCCAGT